MNCGSVLSFQVCTKCGLRPNARQIRDTADWLMPVAAAIDLVDQCVSCPGPCSSTVLAMTTSTCSSVIVRGAPGRGSSERPSSRATANRDRHLATVGRDTPKAGATSVFDPPSAHASTIRDRNASACDVLRRRAHPSSTCRSSGLRTTGSSFGLATRRSPVCANESMTQDTSYPAVKRQTAVSSGQIWVTSARMACTSAGVAADRGPAEQDNLGGRPVMRSAGGLQHPEFDRVAEAVVEAGRLRVMVAAAARLPSRRRARASSARRVTAGSARAVTGRQ